MRIVAILPTVYVRRIEGALRATADVAACGTLPQCEAALTQAEADCVIVDPLLLDPTDFTSILRSVRHRQIPIVFYTSFTAAAIRLVLPALREGAAEVLLADIEDYAERLREVLRSLPAVSIGASLASALAPTLLELNPAVAASLLAVLLDPTWSSAKELPARTKVSRRTIERTLVHAHLAPLHRWCSVARLARAFTALAERRLPYHETATIAGYGSTRSLARQFRTITGMSLDEARDTLSRRDFVAVAVRALHEPRVAA